MDHRSPLAGVQAAGLGVDDAQGADAPAVTQHQRKAGVETDARLTDHQGVVGKARILQGVRHFQCAVAQNGVRTERLAARCLGGVWQPMPGLEPLALTVHQAQQ